jgi:AraC family transcriptional regulator
MPHPLPYSCTPEEPGVRFAPPDLVERQSAEWPGLRVDIVTARQQGPFDYSFKSRQHLLIAAENAERDDGETLVEGLPKSTLHSFSGRLTFVPAGREFYGWQKPRVLTRVNYYYIDPQRLPVDDELRFSEIEFRPNLFFFDSDLWQVAEKLKQEVAKNGGRMRHYGEALGVLLGHELVRLNTGAGQPIALAKGGLTSRQQKKLAEFIDAHLAEEVPLRTLAALVDLSPFHFARAFKQSFGLPPHRYHVSRRIERAKALLGERSVTEVAMAVGFAETSSFSAAFRKATGASPREFRRASK